MEKRMSKMIKKIIITTILCSTAACGGVRDAIGLKSSAPDEFRVVSNVPLVVPPEFNLRPPMPGIKRPQEASFQQQAKDILFETTSQKHSVTESKGESVFLKRADIVDSNPEIKELLAKEEWDTEDAEQKKGFLGKIISYTSSDKSKEPIVNPSKEKQRLEKNKKEDKPANQGSVAETEERDGGLLDRVFGF
jgi:hypothetical protein